MSQFLWVRIYHCDKCLCTVNIPQKHWHWRENALPRLVWRMMDVGLKGLFWAWLALEGAPLLRSLALTSDQVLGWCDALWRFIRPVWLWLVICTLQASLPRGCQQSGEASDSSPWCCRGGKDFLCPPRSLLTVLIIKLMWESSTGEKQSNFILNVWEPQIYEAQKVTKAGSFYLLDKDTIVKIWQNKKVFAWGSKLMKK